MQTCVALTNTYLYLGEFNSQYYTEFMSVSEITPMEEISFFY